MSHFPHFFLIFYFLVLISVWGIGSAAKIIPPPTIKLTAYQSGRSPYGPVGEERTINLTILDKKKLTYLVPSTVGGLVLECNGSYPVMWNLAESDINPEIFSNVKVQTKRTASDLFDTKTFNYTTQLSFYGHSSSHKFTGNYSCQNAGRRSIQTNVFIYWDADEKKSLVHSQEKITKYLKNGKVRLPCGVSNPSSKPELQKVGKGKGGVEKITKNSSVLYSPTTGFTLDNVPNPTGTYRCILDEQNQDVVTILVKNTSTIDSKSNATFTFDTKTNELECCSKSKRPPTIFLMYCEHAVTCQLREHVIEPYHYIISRSQTKGSCARKPIRFYHTILARCFGDGINEYKEIVTSLSGLSYYDRWGNGTEAQKIDTFFRWDEIESQEMLFVQFSSFGSNLRYGQKPVDSVIYAKQSVNVQCVTSQYYFSEGNYWAIRWKNKTVTVITDPHSASPEHASLLQSDRITYKMEMSMEAIMCFAPVWNSSLWVIKTAFLYLNETKTPNLIQNETVDLSWYTKEQNVEMVCEAKGTPDPTFTWEQGSTEIMPNSHNYNMTTIKHNGTNVVKSTLKISTVSYSSHGRFACKATNYGGTSTRIFNVSVMERSSWKTATVITIVTIITVLLIIATIFIWRRMKIDQKAIQQLTSVHFKDATTREQVVGVDVTNTRFDRGKITNQLIS